MALKCWWSPRFAKKAPMKGAKSARRFLRRLFPRLELLEDRILLAGTPITDFALYGVGKVTLNQVTVTTPTALVGSHGDLLVDQGGTTGGLRTAGALTINQGTTVQGDLIGNGTSITIGLSDRVYGSIDAHGSVDVGQ